MLLQGGPFGRKNNHFFLRKQKFASEFFCPWHNVSTQKEHLFLQDLWQVYQNRSERHLTVFCINPNDLALLFLTSIRNFQTGFFANGPHSHYLRDLQITSGQSQKCQSKYLLLQFQDCLYFTPLPCMPCPIENETNR